MIVQVFDEEITIDESLISQPPDEIERQIAEYVQGERTTFDLDVHYPEEFTGAVMAAMSEIPVGETRTYGQIAADLETAAIAVGQACARNPVPIVVPCHRIVGADSFGGFSASGGIDLKKRLLIHEGATSEDRELTSPSQ